MTITKVTPNETTETLRDLIDGPVVDGQVPVLSDGNFVGIDLPQGGGSSEFKGFRALGSLQTVVVNQAPAIINYSSVPDLYDTTGGYNRSTQIFTAPQPGFWKFRAQVTDEGFRQKAITMDLILAVNGSFRSIASESNALATTTTRSIVTISLEETLPLETGDEVTIRGFCRGDSFVLAGSNSNIRNSFSGVFLGPPVSSN